MNTRIYSEKILSHHQTVSSGNSVAFYKILECRLAINGYVLSLIRFMDGLLDTLFYQVWLYLVFLDAIQILD